MKVGRSVFSQLSSVRRRFQSSVLDGKIFWYDEVTSTMDVARELCNSNKDEKFFAVVASRQTKGRGTKGRTWQPGIHNLHLTVSVAMSSIRLPLTMVPLRIGIILANCIKGKVYSGEPVYLKWPNDVLIGNKKVCGVLIEIEDGRMLIGIGVNVGSAPAVAVTGKEGGRPATCLRDHLLSSNDKNVDGSCSNSSNTTGINVGGADGENELSLYNIAPTASTTSSSQSSSPSPTVDFGLFCKDLAEEVSAAIYHWLESNSLPTSNSNRNYGMHNNNFMSINPNSNFGGYGGSSSGGGYFSGDTSTDSTEKVIEDFHGFMDSSPQVLRREYSVSNRWNNCNNNNESDNNNNTNNNNNNNNNNNTNSSSNDSNSNDTSNNSDDELKSVKGEEVVPLGLNVDGTLKVRMLRTGAIQTLVADYLW